MGHLPCIHVDLVLPLLLGERNLLSRTLGGLGRMEEEGLPLRRLIPGAARAAPGPSARPILSEPLLHRMQAAIDAAKGQTAEQDQDPLTEPIPRIVAPVAGSGETAAPAVNGVSVNRDRIGKPRHTAKRDRDESQTTTAKPGRAGLPKHNTHSRRTTGAQPAAKPEAPETASASPAESAAAKSESLPQPARAAETASTPERSTALPQRTPQAQRPTAYTQPTALPQRTPPAEPAAKPQSTALPQRTPQAERPAAHTQPTALPQRTPAAEPAGKPQPTAPPVRTERAGEPAARTGTRSAPTPAKAASPETTERSAPDRPSRPAKTTIGARRASPAARAPASRMRPPRGRQQASRRRRVGTAQLIASVVVVVVAASVAVVLSQHSAPTPDKTQRLTPQQERIEAQNDALAAAWVSGQVSHSVVVSCDQQTCAALKKRGFPAANVRVLGAKTGNPLSSTIVIGTPSVRGLFGHSLASAIAPAVLAVIGSGPAQIDIRLVAPHGTAVFQRALKTYWDYWKPFGAELLSNNAVNTSTTAKAQLTDGPVDGRLLQAILTLASYHAVDIVDFGNGNHATSGVPLRYADLLEDGTPAQMSTSAYVKWMEGILRTGMPKSLQPAWWGTVHLSDGQVVLRIEFVAPTPLNEPGSTPSGG